MIRLLRLGVLVGLLVTVLVLTGAAIGAPGDVDNDTIADASDNCPSVYNIDQKDFDSDGAGNTCDPTPGVASLGFGDVSYTIIYFRDATTGGPLSADLSSSRCASVRRDVYENNVLTMTTNPCYRQFADFINPPTRRQTLTFSAAPAGCQAQFTSPITVNYNGSYAFEAFSVYYLCDEGLALENLRGASVGVGPGKSLADKAALAQSQYASGNVAGACTTLTGYINEVKALSGKKIPTATANALIAQAQALRTEIGC